MGQIVFERIYNFFRSVPPKGEMEGRLTPALFGSALAGVCVIVLLAAMFLVVVAQERAADRLRTKTLSALRLTDRATNDLANMELAHREYLETGQPHYLESFRRRRAALDYRFDDVARSIDVSADETETLAHIRTDFDQWVRRVALPQIALRQAGSDPASIPKSLSDVPDIQTIRFALARFGTQEADAFGDVQRRLERVRLWQTGGFMILVILAIVLLVASSRNAVWTVKRHVRRVERTEAETRLIIDSTLDGVLTTNADGVILMANPAVEGMFGAPAAEICGRHISELLPQRAFAEPLARLGGKTITADARRMDSTHDGFPVEIAFSHSDIAGERRYVALVRDITERRRNEAALRHIGLGVSAATGEAFVKSFVSELCNALLLDCAFLIELEKGSPAGRHIMTMAERGIVCGSGECGLAGTACGETLRSGFCAWLTGVRAAYPDDWMLAAFEAESFVAMPLVDESGAYTGIIGVIDHRPMDQVEMVESTLQIFGARAAAELQRKRYERDLAEEKERLAVTLRSIGDGCVAINNDGTILLMNPVAEAMTGWPQEEAVGRQVSDVFSLIDERTRRPRRKALRRIVETGSNVDILGPAVIVSRHETERIIETNAAPIRDPADEKIGVVFVFRDITERHRIVEERQKAEKLESLGVAAGGIAHDFNNLLTAILGNLSLSLFKPDLDSEIVERLTTAKKASLRAQDLAQQLLTFAKGGAPIKHTASVAQLIRDTVGFSLRGSNVRSEFEIPDDLWPAEIDAGQISQVIQNLAINADQAMPAGGTLSVSCSNFELAAEHSRLGLTPGRYLKISVKDEGIGIPESKLNKIFDPYFTTKPKGSGLGLATSYSIMKNHGGFIDVVSRPGSGTCFHLFLPASSNALPAEAETISKRPVPDGGGRSKRRKNRGARVLVLDDEQVICALVTCALAPLGYEVAEANDAASAIRMYSEAMEQGRRFDVVISDLTIPGGMGGREAVKRLREIDPQVKAIVSSGYATDPVMSAYRDYGFCAMIAKPYEIEALGAVVADVLATPAPLNVLRQELTEPKSA